MTRALWQLIPLWLLLSVAAGTVFARDITLGAGCALHEAILAANQDAPIAGCPGGEEADVISLAADIILTGPLPPIASEINIDGNGFSISGAGLHRVFDVAGGDLTIKNLTVADGVSEGDGGAIRLRAGGSVHIESAIFRDNRAANGGAIALTSAGVSLTVYDSRFESNRAESSAGAIWARGGTITIQDSQFDGNCAEQVKTRLTQAGDKDERSVDADGCATITYYRRAIDDAIEAGDGGAIQLLGETTARFDGVAFRGNKASYGGAIAASHGTVRIAIDGSSFVENTATLHGGAVYAFNGGINIAASSFVKNSAEGGGGAIEVAQAQLDIRNSTFGDNRSDHGASALRIAGANAVTITHATFVDNWSLYGNRSVISSFLGARVRLRNSIVAGSSSAEACVGGLAQNTGNLSSDGACADATTAEILLDRESGAGAYYPLLDHSPAVDAADPDFCLETDQLGNPRSRGGGCDIGAIESATALPARPTPRPMVCTLRDQIVAANSKQAAGACPPGTQHTVISITEDITLQEALPPITSVVTIDGNGFSISGDGKFRIFDTNRARLTINDLTLTNGKSFSQDGAAIRLQGGSHVTVNDSRFIRNYADNGGAIDTNSSTDQLTVRDSSFYRNGAGRNGGAIYLNFGNATISGSSFAGNSAGHDGGAIRITNHGRLTIENSSLIHNYASWAGDAISLENGAVADITHVTMSSGFSYGTGYTLYIHEPGYGSRSRVNLRNSIIAGEGYTGLCFGPLSQNAGNLIERGACSPEVSDDPLFAEAIVDAATEAPLLLPLQEDSPAIKAADPMYCLPVDQRGNARHQVGACDIGAYETDSVRQELTDCAATTTQRLNFRDAPGRESHHCAVARRNAAGGGKRAGLAKCDARWRLGLDQRGLCHHAGQL